MDPEENDDAPTVVETDEPVVIVVDDDSDDDDTPAVETGDTTVVVAPAPTDGGSDFDPLTERIVNIERDIADLRSAIGDIAVTASIAAEDATEALSAADSLAQQDEEIVEAVDDAIIETVEGAELDDVDDDGDDEIITDEIAPASSRVHWLFRSREDWKN